MERLRELLTRHPRGLSLYDLAEALDVTDRSVRRYLKEVERQYDLERVPTRGGGRQLWRIRPSEIPRKVELRRTQAYALLAARRLFEPLKGSALFEEIGPVADVFLPADRNTGRPKGCAFIEFEEPNSVATAIEKFDGYELNGRMLRVNEAEERPQRPRFSPDARPNFAGKKSRPKGSRRKIRGRKRSL